ncbi:hypothetical protein DFJ58DRAFT_729571 [Suillus subalutaceus]|uniref:uncharacterized protein n=1 Tax=Suillus subalutaceus TaxID=48586 RepID=UPI001B8652C9|nr:uncharacterized protein DFJ58DRAFT_729571 [Suillus subalutaceus]KAG1849283.1 hypothetical protein DFJ58DRAFT_729571 [Suillus subalutaceus]
MCTFNNPVHKQLVLHLQGHICGPAIHLLIPDNIEQDILRAIHIVAERTATQVARPPSPHIDHHIHVAPLPPYPVPAPAADEIHTTTEHPPAPTLVPMVPDQVSPIGPSESAVETMSPAHHTTIRTTPVRCCPNRYYSDLSPYYMSEPTYIISRIRRASGPWADGRNILNYDGWAGRNIIPNGGGWAHIGNM